MKTSETARRASAKYAEKQKAAGLVRKAVWVPQAAVSRLETFVRQLRENKGEEE